MYSVHGFSDKDTHMYSVHGFSVEGSYLIGIKKAKLKHKKGSLLLHLLYPNLDSLVVKSLRDPQQTPSKKFASLAKMFSANNPAEIPQKSLQIQQDDKFFSRLLSKESSIANPSLRVYYGGLPGAVPFLWESQPGTPKYKFCDDTLPPLTPPPSYYTNSNKKKPANKKTSRSNLLHTLFPKKSVNVKKTSKQQSLPCQSSPVPSFWSSSSSDSSSMVFPMNTTTTTTTTTKYQGGMNRFSRKSSSLESLLGDADEEMRVGSPTSTLCFGFSRVSSSVGLRGCYGRF